MNSGKGCRPVTRRQAIGRIVLGGAALAGAPRYGLSSFGTDGHAGRHLGPEANGAEIWQVTTEEFPQSNIYCETPYCDADSRYFVYQRRHPKLTVNRVELMVVELGTWKQHRLDTAFSTTGLAVTPRGVLYYLKRGRGGSFDLMRADIAKGIPQRVYVQRDGSRNRSLGTVSADERYYVTGTRPGDGWDRFGILLVDLEEGVERILDEDPFILNAHPQFDPASHQLLIQHNRGGEYSADGRRLRLVGPEGATLYLLSVPDGRRTTLSVGKPYTTPCTGHEAWIGTTQEVLLSVSARDKFAPQRGNLLGVRAGQPARTVAKGYRFNHVGVSRCGLLFSGDDWRGDYRIVIGSVSTGATAVVCASRTRPDGSQQTHPHPYLTPDRKWVIFNSNRNGFPHVHAASVPEKIADHILNG